MKKRENKLKIETKKLSPDGSGAQRWQSQWSASGTTHSWSSRGLRFNLRKL